MFDLGFGELLIACAVALVVLKPEELSRLASFVKHFRYKLRQWSEIVEEEISQYIPQETIRDLQETRRMLHQDWHEGIDNLLKKTQQATFLEQENEHTLFPHDQRYNCPTRSLARKYRMQRRIRFKKHSIAYSKTLRACAHQRDFYR